MSIPEAEGDWNVRGRDQDTELLRSITDVLIDADRLVREEWDNSFPNWYLYRAAYLQERHAILKVQPWVAAFSIACLSTSMRSDAYSDELAFIAGMDALNMLIYSHPLLPAYLTAADLGVHTKTYVRARNSVYVRLKKSLDEYWELLGIHYRIAKRMHRKCENANSHVIMAMRGSISPQVGIFLGEGNYFCSPGADSDDS